MKPPMIAFYDSKSYEIDFFENQAKKIGIEFKYFNNRLNSDTVAMSNGFEGFWGFAKSRLSRFRGMHKNTFYLHLKECEFRYNNRNENMYDLLLREFRKEPLI